MGYIKSVLPINNYRLFMEMEGGSTVTVELSDKLHTMKSRHLKKKAFFRLPPLMVIM